MLYRTCKFKLYILSMSWFSVASINNLFLLRLFCGYNYATSAPACIFLILQSTIHCCTLYNYFTDLLFLSASPFCRDKSFCILVYFTLIAVPFINITSYNFLSYYSLHCSSFSGPGTESTYRGNLTESKLFEQSMPTSNQVPTDSLGSKQNHQGHNANNVSNLSEQTIL